MKELVRQLRVSAGTVLAMTPFAATAAAGSLAVVLGHGRGWPAIALWLIGFGLVVAAAVRARAGDRVDYAGEVPARVLLFAAASAAAVVSSPAHRGRIWLIAAILMATVLVEPMLAQALPRREVVNLPGYRPTPGVTWIRWLSWVSTAVLALAGALGLVRVAVVVRWLPATAAVIAVAATAMIDLRSWRDRFDRRARLHDALSAYAPQFVLYTGREDGGGYQIAMWLPYLERLGVRYAIVVRRPNAVPALARLTHAPIVARSSLRALDDVMVDSIRTVFYVNSVAANSDAVAYRSMRHVYLGHGDSDKSLSHHPAHAMYDEVFVAGQAAIDRYRRNGVAMRPDAFVVVGRPQLEAVHPARALPDRPTVLYAPTWIGYNSTAVHSSLPVGLALVRRLLERDVVVVFRPHPFSRKRAGEREVAAAIDDALRSDAVRTGRRHQYGPAVDAAQFADSANACDAMIADMSSILVDFLGSDKPMAVTVSAADRDDFLERHPVAQGAYLLDADGSNLTVVLDAMIGADPVSGAHRPARGPDPMRVARERTRDYYLGGLDGAAATVAFLSAATACLRPVHRAVDTGSVLLPATGVTPGGQP